MKIVIATHHFPPNYIAGVELYAYRMAQYLLREGHLVWVVCVESTEGESRRFHCVEDNYDGIPVRRLHLDLAQAPDRFRRKYWNPDVGNWFEDFLSEVQPDLVHMNSCYLLSVSIVSAAKKLGLPVALTLHDYWFLCARATLLKPDGSVCNAPDDPAECAWCLLTGSRRYRLPEMASRGVAGQVAKSVLRRPAAANLFGWQSVIDALQERQNLLREALNQVDVVIVATRFLKNMLTKRGYPPEKILRHPYGLDTSGWQLNGSSEAQPAHLRFAYIGQITHQKGIHILIQAFNRLMPPAEAPTLEIYGNLTRFPRYAARLRKLAAQNDRIRFAGTYDNKDTPQVFAAIDALAVPSVWYEGSPLIIQEALATKTPVIASNLGGMAESIRHDVDGLLAEAGDVDSLAQQLQRLLDEPDLLARLRDNIRPVRAIEDEMMQLMEVYQTLALDGSGPRRTDNLWPAVSPATKGRESMRDFIPFTRVYVGEEEKAAVLRALDAGRLGGNGPISADLQDRLRASLGVRHALLTTSCSHAMELAAMALRFGPGDEIIMPSFTFVTTASSVLREGARPVFVDIDEATFNIDPTLIEAHVTPRTKAIVPVHYAGQGCDMDEILKIAERHHLYVIEDAAQGLGASYTGRPLGTIGHIGCFSFHVTKNVICGEGGLFVTNDDTIYERAEIIREKGTNRSKFLRGEVDKYTWVDLGSSFVLSDMLSAVALAQLEKMDEINDLRKQVWNRYQVGLEEVERRGSIIRPWIDPRAQPNWHIYAFRVVEADRRDKMLEELKRRGIGATFHFVPLHSSPYANQRWNYRAEDLPITERVAASLVRLPIYPGLKCDEQDYIIESLYEVDKIV